MTKTSQNRNTEQGTMKEVVGLKVFVVHLLCIYVCGWVGKGREGESVRVCVDQS